jgi:hypothetical protein
VSGARQEVQHDFAALENRQLSYQKFTLGSRKDLHQRAGLERRGLWHNLSFFRCTSLVGKKMAKKIELNKKTLRVLSVDELAAVAGGTLDSSSDTSLRTIDGPDTFHTMNANAPAMTAPPVEGDGTP